MQQRRFPFPFPRRRTGSKRCPELQSPRSSTASCSSSDSEYHTVRSPNDEIQFGFSFSGGGWLMIYMYGVAKALRVRRLHSNARFIGTSAGAMAAVGLYLGADFDVVCESVLTDFLPLARGSVRGAFRVREYLQQAMLALGNVHAWEKTQVDPLACRVVYTSLSAMKSRRKSTFKSQEDLLAAVMASCTATPIAGFPFKYDGEWVMDGGIFDNQPLFTQEDGVRRTVTITPNVFDSTADIKPSKYIPPWWSLYPPREEDLRWVFALGYKDGLSWCSQHGFVGSPEATAVPTPVYQSKISQYKTALGQVTGYAIFEDIGNVFAFAGKISIYTLLKLELTLWMLLEVGVASIDMIMVCWTSIVVSSLVFVFASQDMEALAVECIAVYATYAVVCAARAHHKSHELKTTAKWQQIQASLVGMKRHANEVCVEEMCGVKAIRSYHDRLPKEHHETLVEHSLLYSISTLLPVESRQAEVRL